MTRPDASDATMRPDAALRHPLFWGALAALLLNDHVLKGAGVLPGAITGKLSDVAGLVVAPIVLAALLRVSTRRGAALSVAAVVAVFSAINLSPAVASVMEAALHWRIWVDPTDLVALPAVCGAWLVMGSATKERAARGLTHALLLLGAFACMATSYEEDYPEDPPELTDEPAEEPVYDYYGGDAGVD